MSLFYIPQVTNSAKVA